MEFRFIEPSLAQHTAPPALSESWYVILHARADTVVQFIAQALNLYELWQQSLSSDDHLKYERASLEQGTGTQARSTCRWGQMLWCSSLRRRRWTSSRTLARTPWRRCTLAQRLSARERCPGLWANLVPAHLLTGIALRSSLASCMECCDACSCSF